MRTLSIRLLWLCSPTLGKPKSFPVLKYQVTHCAWDCCASYGLCTGYPWPGQCMLAQACVIPGCTTATVVSSRLWRQCLSHRHSWAFSFSTSHAMVGALTEDEKLRGQNDVLQTRHSKTLQILMNNFCHFLVRRRISCRLVLNSWPLSQPPRR